MDTSISSMKTFGTWCCLLTVFITAESDSSWEQQQHDIRDMMLRKQLSFPYHDSNFFTFSDMEQIVGGNMTPPFVVSDTCKAYLLAYSTNASEFVHCAIKYARPFRFCGSCVVPYTKAVNLYCDIVKKGDGTCSRQLLNSDRIHLLTQTNDYMQTLWQTSDCNRCFSSVTEHEDGTVDFEIENKTMIFLELYNETGTCMNVTDQELADQTHWAQGSNSSVCKECEDSYRRLNQHFNSILKTSQNHVCMDVVDIMNYTRQIWSQYFNCSHRTGDMIPVLCLTAVFCLCPVFFYVGNRIHGEPDSNRLKIAKQKRFPRFRRHRNYGAVPVQTEIIIPAPDTDSAIVE